MLRKFGIFLICICLTGCGFKMRGALDIPQYLTKLYISPNTPNEPLQNLLRARLKQHGVQIAAEPKDDITRLDLGTATTSETVLAAGSSGEVQRFKLTMNVSYTLIVKGKNGFSSTRTITRSRELNRSNNMLLSNEGQEYLVKKELLDETVNEILRQITTRPLYKESVQSSSTTDDNPC
jgi:LPS-assembly lipoprotein